MASASRFARPRGGPQLSAQQLAEHAQKQAAEESRYRRGLAEAEATFRASAAAVTPLDPFVDVLARVGVLEDQVRALQDSISAAVAAGAGI